MGHAPRNLSPSSSLQNVKEITAALSTPAVKLYRSYGEPAQLGFEKGIQSLRRKEVVARTINGRPRVLKANISAGPNILRPLTSSTSWPARRPT
jgi:hypothetical protein